MNRLRRSPAPADVENFTRARRAHMNAEMERRGAELPDPADLLPPGWRTLPEAYRRALYVESWATVGANIAHVNDAARRGEYYQPPLPIFGDDDLIVTSAGGWCAPSRAEVELR